jgi:hypothetical protein
MGPHAFQAAVMASRDTKLYRIARAHRSNFRAPVFHLTFGVG